MIVFSWSREKPSSWATLRASSTFRALNQPLARGLHELLALLGLQRLDARLDLRRVAVAEDVGGVEPAAHRDRDVEWVLRLLRLRRRPALERLTGGPAGRRAVAGGVLQLERHGGGSGGCALRAFARRLGLARDG